jgi:hypothetical protein
MKRLKAVLNFVKREYTLIVSTIGIALTIYLIVKGKVSFEVGVTTLVALEVFIDKVDKKLKSELRQSKKPTNKSKKHEGLTNQ